MAGSASSLPATSRKLAQSIKGDMAFSTPKFKKKPNSYGLAYHNHVHF